MTRHPSSRPRVWAVVALLLLAQASFSAGQEDDEWRPAPPVDSIIVTYKSTSKSGRAASIDGTQPLDGPSLVALEDGEALEEALARLAADPDVEFVEPNFTVYATRGGPVRGPSGGGGGPGNAANQAQLLANEAASWARDRVQAPAAWQLIGNPPASQPLICVIDSGIDCRHPDLGPACGAAINMITGKTGAAAAVDDNGHGTQIAGGIAAQLNGAGIAGIAPQATLLSCKFMDSTGAGSTYNANACLQWCMRNGATVSVNAWGAENPNIADYTTTLQRTLSGRPDHLFITSAGNGGNSLQAGGAFSSSYTFYPAMLNLNNMLVVAATGMDDELASWPGGATNYGPGVVAIGAPGVDVITTDRTLDPNPAAWYRSVSGSSISTAIVGGGAALLLAAKPNPPTQQLKQWLLDGATRVPGLTSSIAGGGGSGRAQPNFADAASPSFNERSEYATEPRIIVKGKPNSALPGKVSAVSQQMGLAVVNLKGDGDAKQTLEQLQQRPDVEYAVPDGIVWAAGVPDDPEYRFQWGLPRVGAPAAWDLAAATPGQVPPVTVCITDSGIDMTQPDLMPNLHPLVGYSALTQDSNVTDVLQHGTHIAGVVGAVGNNSLQVAGVNWGHVQLLACKFLNDNGFGYTSDAIACIDYCIGVGAHIITNSWAGGEENPALHDAIKAAADKNILFVVAAGNAGTDLDNNATYPASYSSVLPNMLVVGSSGYKDDLSAFSNYGPDTVHLAAPGEWILSTVTNNSTAYFSGTSMAAPLVAGSAALVLRASNFTLSALDLKHVLMATTEPLPSLKGKVATGGILRVDKAMTFVQPASAALAPTVEAVVHAAGEGAKRRTGRRLQQL